jgi:hypothetical protein
MEKSLILILHTVLQKCTFLVDTLNFALLMCVHVHIHTHFMYSVE